MKTKQILKLFDNYLCFYESDCFEKAHKFKVVGIGEINYLLPRVVLLRNHLPKDSFKIQGGNEKILPFSKELLEDDCPSVIIVINIKKGVSLDMLKKAIKVANKEYEKIYEKTPA